MFHFAEFWKVGNSICLTEWPLRYPFYKVRILFQINGIGVGSNWVLIHWLALLVLGYSPSFWQVEKVESAWFFMLVLLVGSGSGRRIFTALGTGIGVGLSWSSCSKDFDKMVDNAKKLKPDLGSLIPSKTKTKEPTQEKEEQKWWLIQLNNLLK